MQIQQNLEKRLAELEMKAIFQEKLVEELNQALIDQQFLLNKCNVNYVI